ncbi:MAG: carboxyl transferase domain-containing protein [SAR86 cluster bacterium]|jgi:acetyl-CoA carboxylase carboxyltransferase component|nr:carboxyl transferase domain-containing protein [SAR86 cluster bacterium]|tara:strand:+ start:9370 stop:10917 length:1548 start_codon:yes stop_codon:yes gene_type:complete
MNWKKETDGIKIRKKLATKQGGKEAVDLQHAKGRLSLRERIEKLLDKGSFQEQGKIAGISDIDDKGDIQAFTPANFILGFGKINGNQIVIAGEDFTVKGGSPNPAGLRKSVYTEELALNYKLPLVRLHEGGGGSVAGPSKKGRSSGGDAVFSKSRFKSVADTLKVIPVVSAALGPVAGLPAARFVASHFRVMTKRTSQILVAGPAVVERAFGKKLTKEELGGSNIHRMNGVTDNVADTEEDAFNQISRFLSYMPQNIYELSSQKIIDDPVNRKEEDLLAIIPKDKKKSYEMREVIEKIFDHDSFFEITRYFGQGIITGFARINGYSVGILANDSNFYAGSMSSKGAQKTSRFIKTCDTFHIPVVSLVDEPGFLIGPEAELEATILHGTEAVLTVTESTIPWCSVIIRKSYGVAAAAHYGPDGYVLAWPSAESGALPIEGGVAVAFKKEISESVNPEAKRKEIEDALNSQQNTFARAESFSVHEIIDPRDTRTYLAEWAERIQSQLRVKCIQVNQL